MVYEYKTVVLRQSMNFRKKRGFTTVEQIAAQMDGILNEQSQKGWEFFGVDHVVAPPASSLFGRREPEPYNVLIFRREQESVSHKWTRPEKKPADTPADPVARTGPKAPGPDAGRQEPTLKSAEKAETPEDSVEEALKRANKVIEKPPAGPNIKPLKPKS